MHYKFYYLLLLGLCFQPALFAQIESPLNPAFTGGELEVRRAVSPSSVSICGDSSSDFGEVIVGEEVTREYLIRNLGPGYLYFQGTSLVGSDDFSISFGSAYEDHLQLIPPGQSVSIFIHFFPSSAGDKEATLYLYTSDSDENPCALGLEGEGYVLQPGTLRLRREGDLYAPPCGTYGSYEFSDLNVGESESKTFYLENAGDEVLFFYGITLSGSPDFSIAYDFPITYVPYPIYPDQPLPFTVTFTPTSPGEKRTYLDIATSEVIKESCIFRMEGGGLEPKGAHLSMFNPNNGDILNCGDTFHIDLSEDYPGPLYYGFYFTLRNYGNTDLQISGSVSIVGVPGSEEPIEPFTVEPLAFKFLQTLVQLPGGQVTTLQYVLATNDPDQPFCTLYVEINQEGGLQEVPIPGSLAVIEKVSMEDKPLENDPIARSKRAHSDSAPSLRPAGRLYPTLARDRIYLELPQSEGKQYQIINAAGRPVRDGQTDGESPYPLNIGNLPAGMYWLKMEGTPGVLRFIKIR